MCTDAECSSIGSKYTATMLVIRNRHLLYEQRTDIRSLTLYSALILSRVVIGCWSPSIKNVYNYSLTIYHTSSDLLRFICHFDHWSKQREELELFPLWWILAISMDSYVLWQILTEQLDVLLRKVAFASFRQLVNTKYRMVEIIFPNLIWNKYLTITEHRRC